MQLFYNSDIQLNSEHVLFSKEESRHIVRVLRKKIDDILNITDGKGNLFVVQIIQADDKKCQARIISSELQPQPKTYRLHLAIAPTKMNDRFEWFLEKATEIGIDEITPIRCDHSERTQIKPERFEKVIQSAMKQSLKFRLPVLNPLCKFIDLVNESKEEAKLIAHCQDLEKSNLPDLVRDKNDILVLIGPEGDFSKKEIQAAINAGFNTLDLGSSRLRTETAGVVVCSNIAFMKDFS